MNAMITMFRAIRAATTQTISPSGKGRETKLKKTKATTILTLLGLSILRCTPTFATETTTYYYTDPQGTPLVTTDASGNAVSTSDYRPYGRQALGTPEARPGYTGHVNDPESGLVYMQARYYDPTVGRFLGPDPARPSPGKPATFNRFAYGSDNPVGNVDPDGRQTLPRDVYQIDWQDHRTRETASEFAIGVVPIAGAVQGVLTAIAEPTATNIALAAVGAIPEIGGAIGAASRGVSAAERATVLANQMGRTKNFVTVAVTETAEGTRVISTNEAYLRGSVKASLEVGEVNVKGVAGLHAEVNGINAAKELGLTPIGSAASRPICQGCAAKLAEENVPPLSPLK